MALDPAMRASNQSANQAFRVGFFPYYRNATASTDVDGFELSLRGFIHSTTQRNQHSCWLDASSGADGKASSAAIYCLEVTIFRNTATSQENLDGTSYLAWECGTDCYR